MIPWQRRTCDAEIRIRPKTDPTLVGRCGRPRGEANHVHITEHGGLVYRWHFDAENQLHGSVVEAPPA